MAIDGDHLLPFFETLKTLKFAMENTIIVTIMYFDCSL